MIEGIIYHTTTGEIVSSAMVPEIGDLLIQTGGDPDLAAMVAAGQPDTHYVENGQVVPKTSMGLSVTGNVSIAANEVLRVDNIPVGTKIITPDGAVTDVDDGFIEWASATSGDYTLIFIHVHHLMERLHALVTDP